VAFNPYAPLPFKPKTMENADGFLRSLPESFAGAPWSPIWGGSTFQWAGGIIRQKFIFRSRLVIFGHVWSSPWRGFVDSAHFKPQPAGIGSHRSAL
jgi:hypothetical protein